MTEPQTQTEPRSEPQSQPQLTGCLQEDMETWLNSSFLILMTARYAKDMVCMLHICAKPTAGWVCMEMENLKVIFKIVMDLKAKGYKLCDCDEPKTYPAENGTPIYVYTEDVNKEGFMGRMS